MMRLVAVARNSKANNSALDSLLVSGSEIFMDCLQLTFVLFDFFMSKYTTLKRFES